MVVVVVVVAPLPYPHVLVYLRLKVGVVVSIPGFFSLLPPLASSKGQIPIDFEMSQLAIASTATVGFTPDLSALLTSKGVGPLFTKYLEECGVQDILDLALLASTDELFEKVLADADIVDKPRDSLKAKKAWYFAREARNQRDAAGSTSSAVATTVSDDGPLSHGIVESLRDGFKDGHKFHLGGSRLLADAAFNATYRGLHRQPKRLKVVLLENVKTMSSLNTNDDLCGILMSRNVALQEIKQSHSAVSTAHELWIRIRIVMSSICYIMMGHAGFLQWEIVE